MSGPLSQGQNGTRNINKKLVTITTAPTETVQSQGTLTIAEPVTAEDTMTIGLTTYTFKADGTAANAGEIDMGADEAATKLAIVKAIKGTDGLNGTNTLVGCESAFTVDALVLTARKAGAHGDGIATTETFTHASNVFDDVTLGTTTAGVGTNADKAAEVGDMIYGSDRVHLCIAKDADTGVTEWRYWDTTAL